MSDDLGAALRHEIGLYTEKDLMTLLECSAATLQEWRSRGLSPAFCKLGKTVMYRRVQFAPVRGVARFRSDFRGSEETRYS